MQFYYNKIADMFRPLSVLFLADEGNNTNRLKLCAEITLQLRNMNHGAENIIAHHSGSSCTTSISCIRHRTELHFIQKLLNP